MLAELSESDATGELAHIYQEIRELCAVPYVSSLQRHLATRSGWLEWAWHALRPAFVDGRAQELAWSLLDELEIAPLPPISPDALRVLEVDEAGLQTLRGICESFIRVSPTNLMQSGMLRCFLNGQTPTGAGADSAARWSAPAALAELPEMVDIAALPPSQRGVLMAFCVDVDDSPFVPGLYRMLARWPKYFAHLATVLAPRLTDEATCASCDRFLARIDAESDRVFQTLPPPSRATPDVAEHASILAVLERYRQTSPQMVIYGALIRDALPRCLG
ncbi:MAG: hypothetical protein K0U93_24430 [Gammaproteobacteria bacterium]|nr:hypothetical protein [Gammaproteobacteria bacterium]